MALSIASIAAAAIGIFVFVALIPSISESVAAANVTATEAVLLGLIPIVLIAGVLVKLNRN